MLFLGIISWKGASRYNGGEGGVFQMGGFIFKWGGGASVLMGGGGFEKNCRMGRVTP